MTIWDILPTTNHQEGHVPMKHKPYQFSKFHLWENVLAYSLFSSLTRKPATKFHILQIFDFSLSPEDHEIISSLNSPSNKVLKHEDLSTKWNLPDGYCSFSKSIFTFPIAATSSRAGSLEYLLEPRSILNRSISLRHTVSRSYSPSLYRPLWSIRGFRHNFDFAVLIITYQLLCTHFTIYYDEFVRIINGLLSTKSKQQSFIRTIPTCELNWDLISLTN